MCVLYLPSNPLMVLGKECRSGKSSWCCFSVFPVKCQDSKQISPVCF